MCIQSEDVFLSGLNDVMALGFIGGLLIKILGRADVFSLVVSEIIYLVSFYVSVDG